MVIILVSSIIPDLIELESLSLGATTEISVKLLFSSILFEKNAPLELIEILISSKSLEFFSKASQIEFFSKIFNISLTSSLAIFLERIIFSLP
ncbi:Uncharacterised protein [Mycoplasmopsis synoviae]|uniref:Uncharacterized protein n=1 Tax=Mycoplasmopsis synoviae TaxID=2109 RepID=A0A3B0PA89_MYCSY|nr:Uncharacterised protein [Mycoplasmopsis synoviae]